MYIYVYLINEKLIHSHIYCICSVASTFGRICSVTCVCVFIVKWKHDLTITKLLLCQLSFYVFTLIILKTTRISPLFAHSHSVFLHCITINKVYLLLSCVCNVIRLTSSERGNRTTSRFPNIQTYSTYI